METNTNTAAELAASDLGNDLLWGVAAIAKHLNREERRVSYQLDRGMLPAGKQGRLWVASKKKLAQYFSNVTSGGGK